MGNLAIICVLRFIIRIADPSSSISGSERQGHYIEFRPVTDWTRTRRHSVGRIRTLLWNFYHPRAHIPKTLYKLLRRRTVYENKTISLADDLTKRVAYTPPKISPSQ
jgi:hypothetical protein